MLHNVSKEFRVALVWAEVAQVLLSDGKQMLNHLIVVHLLRLGSPTPLSYGGKCRCELHALQSSKSDKSRLALKISSPDIGNSLQLDTLFARAIAEFLGAPLALLTVVVSPMLRLQCALLTVGQTLLPFLAIRLSH